MSTAHCLSENQVASFEENGFLHLSNVISEPELELLRAAERRVTRHAMETQLNCSDYRYAADPTSDRPVLHRVDYVATKDPAFLNLCAHPDLLGMCESIQGPDMLPVGLALVIKAPGFGVAVPWHRDPANCKVQPGINIGIYLDDANEANGMLYVVPGSHTDLTTNLDGDTEEARFASMGVVPVSTAAGDVVIHSENVLHGSKAVRSQNTRRVLYLGCRTIAEQLSRGLDAGWVRAAVRALNYTIAHRADSDMARDETVYLWEPPSAEHRAAGIDDYVEMRLTDAHR